MEPKADMTAQELALIMTIFSGGSYGEGFLFPADEDPSTFFEREVGMATIGRHFGERISLLDDAYLRL